MEKTIAKKLREARVDGCAVRCIERAVFGSEPSCGNDGCGECIKSFMTKLGDAIEAEQAERQLPEGIEWPRFEDGELVRFGDGFVNSEGTASIVTRIALSEKHFTINKKQDRICKAYGNRIKRPELEEPDTQEAINHDAALLVSESFFDQRRDEFEDRVFDLLERQRKLMGGE